MDTSSPWLRFQELWATARGMTQRPPLKNPVAAVGTLLILCWMLQTLLEQ